MKILGIDFSSSIRSVALVQSTCDDSKILGQTTESGTRETNAFHLIKTVLTQASIDRSDVDALAIGLGPGSYGGMRVSLSIAQGWQIATGIKTAGFETDQVLAETARQKNIRGKIGIVSDAQRSEFYHSGFVLEENTVTQLSPLNIVTLADLESMKSSGAKLFGPDLIDRTDGIAVLHPDAAVLAQLVFERDLYTSADQLAPIYIRPVTFVKAPPARIDLQ